MVTGLVTSVVLVIISPSVMSPQEGATLLVGNPIFPLTNPAIVSVPAGFLAAIIGTLLSSERDEKKFAEVEFKAQTGYREIS